MDDVKMKLKEYIERLNKIAKVNPKSLDFDVVFATDELSNKFLKVEYFPCIGKYEDEKFIPQDNLHEYELDVSASNSVCIN